MMTDKLVDALKEKMNKYKQLKKNIPHSVKLMKKYKLGRQTSLLFGINPSCVSRAHMDEETSSPKKGKMRRDATTNKEKVEEYFNCPDISTTVPDSKSVRKTGQERKVIDRPLTKIYEDFKKDTNTNIGFSTFASHRPKNVSTTKKQHWYSCLCETCTNIDLKLKALNKFVYKVKKPILKVEDRYALLELSLCKRDQVVQQKFHKRKCIIRERTSCGPLLIKKMIEPLQSDHAGDPLEYTKWEKHRMEKRGKSVIRVMMVRKTSCLKDLIEEMCREADALSKHLFDANWQQKQYSQLIKNLPDKWVVLNLDFVENYSCVSQMEIQAAHWGHEQVTVHPIVCHYKCSEKECNEAVQESLIFISNYKTHDSHAVQTFVTKAYEHLQRKRNLTIEKEIQFTDGCAAQYKSATPFCDISFAENDFNFSIERHFYGSRHGKGACDGEGAVVKSSAKRAVNGEQCVINNAYDLYVYASNSLTRDDQIKHLHFKRTIFYVPEEEIDRKGTERLARSSNKTIKGTRALHCVRSEGNPFHIKVREYSCFCEKCIGIGHGNTCPNKEYVEDWKEVNIEVKGSARVQQGETLEDGGSTQRRAGGRRGQRGERGGRQRGGRGRARQRGGRGRARQRGGIHSRQERGTEMDRSPSQEDDVEENDIQSAVSDEESLPTIATRRRGVRQVGELDGRKEGNEE